MYLVLKCVFYTIFWHKYINNKIKSAIFFCNTSSYKKEAMDDIDKLSCSEYKQFAMNDQ